MSPNPTDFLITPDLSKPSEWTYPIDLKAIEIMKKRVGRESDKTTQKLIDIIGGRTVALLLNGASISELKAKAKSFSYFDLCYMGVNKFDIIEKDILHQMDRTFDIIFSMSEQEMPRRKDDFATFLARDTDNLLMTTLCAMTWLGEADRNRLLDLYEAKLYLMPRLMCRPKYPISLEVIIDELIKCKVEHLILFGADGYYEPEMEGKSELEIIRWNQTKMLNTYYDPGTFIKEKRATGVGVGTVRFNESFKYQPEKIKIVNCSPNSHYKHIPKMSYDEALGALAVGGL